MSDRVKVPLWFWIVGVLALLWNLMGVMAFIMQVTMSAETAAARPEAQRQYYESIPLWVMAAFVVAVFGGTLGCVLLLARRCQALVLFIASLFGVLAQFSYGIFVGNSLEIFGRGALILPLLTIVIGILLIWFARMGRGRQWLT